MISYLEFEKPIAALDARIAELRDTAEAANLGGNLDIASEVQKLEAKSAELLAQTYRNLTPWQKTQVARHPSRPHFRDYVARAFSDFVPLGGDRCFGEDQAIVGGLARTRGHGLRILLYLGPALTLFLVIYALVMIVVGIIAAAAAQGEAQRLIGEAVGAVLFAGGYVVYAAIVASTYDQLGPMPGMGEAVSSSSPS